MTLATQKRCLHRATQNRTLPILLLACMLLLPILAKAHHSFGVFYDMSNVVELDGEVISVRWRNPHIRFELMVVNDDGSETIWALESGSVNTSQRYGVDQNILRVGENLRVAGPASKLGLDAMFVVSITQPGTELIILNLNLARNLPSAGITIPEKIAIAEDLVESARNTASGIFRVWVPVSRPNTGSGLLVWPLTAEGHVAKNSWDPLIDDPALHCVPPGVPVAMDNPYPIDFTDKGDTIVMRLEQWDGVRTIYMNPNTARPKLAAPHMGYSMGHWQDNILVATTTDVDYPFFDDAGSPQSSDAVIVERFSLSEDNTRLDWVAQMTDPKYYTEPVTLSGYWQWTPGEQIKAYQCTR